MRLSENPRIRKVQIAGIVGAGLGAASGQGIDATPWFELDAMARGYGILAGAVATILGWLLLGIGWGAIYVVMNWPHEDMWLPLGQRRVVCGYVGKTRQKPWWDDRAKVWRYPRIEQHLYGSGRYGKGAQPWSDTVAYWYLAHESRWVTDLGLHLREWANIKLRRPLYNYTMNLRNRRRITIPDAKRQRAIRRAVGVRR